MKVFLEPFEESSKRSNGRDPSGKLRGGTSSKVALYIQQPSESWDHIGGILERLSCELGWSMV